MSKTRALADSSGSGGGSLATLSSVGDVNLSTLSSGDVLTRNIATNKWVNSPVSLPSSGPALFNIRRQLRVGPDVLDWGAVSSGSLDSADAFEAAFAGVRAAGLSELFVPAGNYRLHRQIQMNHGVTLKGEHKSHSVLKFYHNGTGLVATGSVENGGGIQNLSIINDSGAQAIAYVQLIANSTHAPDFWNIVDCNFSSFSNKTVQYGLIVNGTARDGSASGGLKGVRNLVWTNSDVFSCDVLTMDFRVARGVTLVGMTCLQAAGAVAKTRFSANASSNPSHNIRALGCSLGDVSIDLADDILLFGDADNVVLTANASGCRVYGKVASISGLNTTNKAYV